MKLKDIIKFFKTYFKEDKSLLIKSFILLFLTSLVGTLYGYLIGLAIDLARTQEYLSGIIVLLVIFLINSIDGLFFDRYGKINLEKFANNIVEKISYNVFVKVGLLPSVAFEEKSSGELINRTVNDATTIAESFRQVLRIAISLFTSIIVFIYICFNSLYVSLIIIIYLILFYFISKKYLPNIKGEQEHINKEKDEIIAITSENIRGIREIRALGIRKNMNNTFKKKNNKLYSKLNNQAVIERNYIAWIGVLNYLLEFSVFATCIILIITNRGTFAFFMAMTYYIYRFMNTIDLMTNFSTYYQKMVSSIERINEILDNKLYQDEINGKVNKTNITGNIKFSNVTFKYPNEDKETLKDFNLSIPTNKKVAIVGKSGQGKTTIFNLLLKYFKPTNGTIYIDDIPLDDFTEESLRQNIAIIRQESFLFNKTILENLKIVNNKLTLEQIRSSCKLAEVDDYIMSLPNQYNTMIGEGGINLSGGQKQRLAIARALLKQSKIILFDEATSALDNENQSKIKQAIDNLVKDHTIIIVAHRLSTIIDADIIYLIEDGKLIDEGTHNELIKKNKTYKKLYANE